MKQPVYLEDMSYRMIKYVAKEKVKSVLDFLTAFALQEYQELDKKPLHIILSRRQDKCKEIDNNKLSEY